MPEPNWNLETELEMWIVATREVLQRDHIVVIESWRIEEWDLILISSSYSRL